MAASSSAQRGDETEEMEKNIEDRLQGLNLQGEEEADLDLSGELDEIEKEVRWLALVRVHTTKPFSHSAFFSAMRIAWAAAKDVTFKVMPSKRFLVQMQCLGDWNRMMEGGPWLFRGSAVVVEEYDGFSNVNNYKLDKIPVWVRIQGVPEALMKKRELAERVASKVGKTIAVVVNEGRLNPTSYLRARVWLQLDSPIVRVIPIKLKERRTYLVQYEKMPHFCFHCGLIGHEVLECGDGVHDKETCQWGEWLRVPFIPMVRESNDSWRGRGRRGGGGRGRGRGAEFDEVGEDMDYTEQVDMNEDLRDGSDDVVGEKGVVVKQVHLLENTPANLIIATSPQIQEKKRLRRSEESSLNKNVAMNGSAPSDLEGDRKQ